MIRMKSPNNSMHADNLLCCAPQIPGIMRPKKWTEKLRYAQRNKDKEKGA